ncbi:hypothetical protein, partial [Streptomyces sp. NRRL F-5123]|uniref:hypothetical protein n=1 Tax=Streptomyces sp. NRRL F-5123 TaxID=1463856 RepID=UPI0004E20BFE
MSVPDWWSIEVMDIGNGAVHTASGWRGAYAQVLAESLVTNGASTWRWSEHTWGVALEVAFAAEADWERWHSLPGTRAALDAVPDPVRGLLVHRGPAGSAGAPAKRSPRVPPYSAAMSL